MKLAAIDIGSNAIRLQIVNVFVENELVSFKKLEFLRFPLRLGYDVFTKGRISLPVIDKFSRLMQAFKLLIDLYEANAYSAVATSAMREAVNGQELKDYIRNLVGLEIAIISGEEEARVLNRAIIPYLQPDRQYIHIDVGGGSTELNLFDGKSHQASQSFRIGSVRKLSAKDRSELFSQMKKWITDSPVKKSTNLIGIGTGGNINKLYKLANRTRNLSISLAELKGLRAYVKAFSNQERMSLLKMNPDRADVIVPASEIYLKVLQYAGSDEILVPKVGLKDGLIYELYEQVADKSLDQIEFLQEF